MNSSFSKIYNDVRYLIKMPENNDEWKKKLTKEQYHILREKGTEIPFSGKFVNHKENGIYDCAACGSKLFSSNTKFDSGCGWPSFFATNGNNVVLKKDNFLGMHRTEVICKKCRGHLGHLFDDAPQTPTGQRYCINSVALEFKKEK